MQKQDIILKIFRLFIMNGFEMINLYSKVDKQKVKPQKMEENEKVYF